MIWSLWKVSGFQSILRIEMRRITSIESKENEPSVNSTTTRMRASSFDVLQSHQQSAVAHVVDVQLEFQSCSGTVSNSQEINMSCSEALQLVLTQFQNGSINSLTKR